MDRTQVILSVEATRKYIAGCLHLNCYYSKLVTTAFVRNLLPCGEDKIDSVVFEEFTDEEISKLIDFCGCYNLYDSIGFNDASVLYYALSHEAPVIVLDKITERICRTIGITIIGEAELSVSRGNCSLLIDNLHIPSHETIGMIHCDDCIRKTFAYEIMKVMKTKKPLVICK